MTFRATPADVTHMADATLINHIALALAEAGRRSRMAPVVRVLLEDTLHEMGLESRGRTPGGLSDVVCPGTLSDSSGAP